MSIEEALVILLQELNDIEASCKSAADKARGIAQYKSYDEGYANGCESMCNEIADKVRRTIQQATNFSKES